MADANRELARTTNPIDDVDTLMMSALSPSVRDRIVLLLHPGHRLRYWLADLQASVYIKGRLLFTRTWELKRMYRTQGTACSMTELYEDRKQRQNERQAEVEKVVTRTRTRKRCTMGQ